MDHHGVGEGGASLGGGGWSIMGWGRVEHHGVGEGGASLGGGGWTIMGWGRVDHHGVGEGEPSLGGGGWTIMGWGRVNHHWVGVVQKDRLPTQALQLLTADPLVRIVVCGLLLRQSIFWDCYDKIKGQIRKAKRGNYEVMMSRAR